MAASSSGGDNVAFLLSQLGHRSAAVFADLIAAIDLTPPHAGILRAIASEPGRSQQALSGQLGLLPSRVVAYVDELVDWQDGLRPSGDDRRLHALHLSASGKKIMSKIGELGRQHETLMTSGLDKSQCDTLRQLLSIVAEEQGLTPHVHPGYRTLGRTR